MHTFRRSLIALSLGLACASGFAQNDAPVKVGLLSTLSGPGAGLGVDIRDGFQLAVKLSGGKFSGKAVDVIVADDQASPDVGRQTADRLVKRDKVDFMTGIVFSNVMLAVGAPTFQSKTFYISANAGPSQFAGEQCNPYFFSASYQNDNMHEAVGKVVTDKGFKKVALIAPNYPAGKDAIAGFKRFFKGEVASETYTALNQLDYGTELSKLRATKPDAVYIFLPGGMGINFIKQFVGAGLSKDITLFGPGFSGDEDVIKAVGEPMLGMFNTSQWGHDMDNAANKKFVAEFEKAYGRLPTLYAAQGYDAARLIEAAVRDSKGKLDDKAAVRKALEAAKFDSVRGAFKFNSNHFPIQDYYLRVITKDAKGRVTNRTLSPVFKNHADAYVASCKMSSL
ncbi:MAG: ABC transporter substrate-binding protein [Burkholderiales bacterium 35-55-47]|uniref:ABC transporter substrate-binding protein n=1 Tax=Limnohabitans sp. TaxID=1907725 RepID=UPI000BCF7458|nr:ABC transporter substrate-binding protein [Limnohabitans sp.]OYY20469.1 MAG: ABC transporter substrate-binding protein [Burkholderiales bacterium 35-55-47]OYZ74901.1 MAG: ABC transporter substrate-binding protein [Burkholderiales bacterium 24-55-52]OZB02190.1 MAG: ABC transporter substrate-binding protein [Burkholderiales bacterium 39-55-53]HQR86244.1 ABC transporter substrate-binding protein [Limnohabitans sp.]HQS25839.1 ABC transporter substrate-binding protein [Limnohabitans sp.]